MPDSKETQVVDYCQRHHDEIESSLRDTFVRHAIDNRGMLMSTRRAPQVAKQLSELALEFVAGEAEETDIAAIATQFAEQGMAMVTGRQLMLTLGQVAWRDTAELPVQVALTQKLADFQLHFLEKLANARELAHHRAQESSQMALQRALHTQLDQQRQLRRAQEQRNQSLSEILRLNARLARITEESDLLDEAVSGICQALELADVTIYERDTAKKQWALRTTTMSEGSHDHSITPQNMVLLDTALSGDGEIISRYLTENGNEALSVTTVLRVGQTVLGAMSANSGDVVSHQLDTFPIFLRTFAQNLASLWRNLFLFQQTKQRARELEILHGRYVDSIWGKETATLRATYGEDGLQIDRDSAAAPAAGDQVEGKTIPLRIGNQAFGYVKLPDDTNLSDEEEGFAYDLIREMGNALNNARLLQTSRAYSNQLSLAAEVSQAATTLLDRELLIKEVVELIRTRFNFYYVGLFLVDDKGKTAVLKAGTGEVGRLQVAQGHKHVIGGNSMIGTAVSTGQTRVEQDVSQAEAFSFNPQLPDTRSELALPLRTRGHVIGALTVQSIEKGAFNQETVTVLQSLADQLAVAIENASLFARLQANLTKTNRLYQTSRQVSEAANEIDVYEALVDFAKRSELVDAAHVTAVDPTAPEYFISPIIWNGVNDITPNSEVRFLRDDLPFNKQLTENEPFVIRDIQTDPTFAPLVDTFLMQLEVHAAALLPISVETEWLGVLVLYRTKAEPLTASELQPFVTLVDQAAVILSNQQLLKQTEALYRIGRKLSQALTRDDVLTIAVQEVAQYTGAAQCRVVLYEERAGFGTIEAESMPTGLAGRVKFAMSGDFVYERLQKSRQPILLEVNESNVPPEVSRQYLEQFGAQAALLIPSASQKELTGFMALDSRHGTQPFSQNNINFARTIVDHLTTQIENLKLLDEALNRAQELITLNQIQANVSRFLDLEELATAVYQQVGRLLDNTVFLLAQYDAETSTYSPLLYMVEGEPIDTQPRILTKEDSLYQFLHSGYPIMADQSTLLAPGEIVSARPPKSSLWVSLQQEDKPKGLLSVQSHETHAYNENDIQLLRSIATHTNLAIENAKLFEKIQANVVELRQLDELKTQFLANMSHELRTPLNSIIGFSRVMLKGIDGPLTPEQEEDLTSIYDNGQHLLALINKILDMAKIEAGKMALTFETVDLEEVARAALDTARGLTKEGVELNWDVDSSLSPIEADPVRLRQILINLLSNAAKYTYEGQIRLEIKQQDGEVYIAVRDSGVGIAPEDFDILFRAFERVDSSTTRIEGGTGLGLPITQWLVNMHGGKIWFESEVNQGSTFHVALPLCQKDNAVSEGPISEPPSSASKQQQ